MKVLLCNDDGYLARGLKVLEEVTSAEAETLVVAPDRNRTAAGHSLTLHKPLTIKYMENGFYCTNGTPTDCVHLALSVLHDFKPDWIFSGVNHGANLGDDVLYSGTVSAAMQGFMMGVPAVAFSCHEKTNKNWEEVKKILPQLIQKILRFKPPRPVLWNINLPPLGAGPIKGIKIAPLGHRSHNESVVTGTNPYGEKIYWIGVVSDPDYSRDNTDFFFNNQGFITVTPLMADLTATSEFGPVETIFTSALRDES